jgi:hypothetical protein
VFGLWEVGPEHRRPNIKHLERSDTKAKRSNTLLAKRANLPLAGELRGQVTIVQEDRFRLEDPQGRGYLFILGKMFGVSMIDLHFWLHGRTPVIVQYPGPPDLGAVAHRVAVERC